jgi:hypothetical protein
MIAALAETYPSMSDGQDNRRAAVLHKLPRRLAEAGSEGTRATRLQNRALPGFFRRKESIERHHRRDVGCF